MHITFTSKSLYIDITSISTMVSSEARKKPPHLYAWHITPNPHQNPALQAPSQYITRSIFLNKFYFMQYQMYCISLKTTIESNPNYFKLSFIYTQTKLNIFQVHARTKKIRQWYYACIKNVYNPSSYVNP